MEAGNYVMWRFKSVVLLQLLLLSLSRVAVSRVKPVESGGGILLREPVGNAAEGWHTN